MPLSQFSVLRVFVVLLAQMALLGWAGEAAGDPALESAKATYEKEMEALKTETSQKEAKIKAKLDAAYQAAIKRAMAKGDLAAANRLRSEMGGEVDAAETPAKPVAPVEQNTEAIATAFKALKPQLPTALVRIPGQAESHDVQTVVAAITDRKLDGVFSGKKTEKSTPNGDGAFEGGGGHRETTYYVLPIQSRKSGSSYLQIKAAPHHTVSVWQNGEMLFKAVPKAEMGDYFIELSLAKGTNTIVVAYKNTWDSRWVRFALGSTDAVFIKP